jgi:hypothetical protein
MLENKMTHCPKCGKPVLNAGQFWGCAQFTMKCPWCQSILTVSVQQQVTAKLKNPSASGNSEYQQAPEYSAMGDDMGFDSPSMQQRQAASQNEDGFKVVGYIYPQGDKKPSG